MLTAERVSSEGVVLDLAMEGLLLLEGAEGRGGGYKVGRDEVDCYRGLRSANGWRRRVLFEGVGLW